jgi:hypothetical protein
MSLYNVCRFKTNINYIRLVGIRMVHHVQKYLMLYLFWVSELNSKGDQKGSVDSEELRRLEAQHPDILARARAPATNDAYSRAFQKWKTWTLKYNHIICLPASPKYVALYLINVANTSNTFSTVNLASASIAWAHHLAGHESPTKNVLVVETLAGLKSKLAKPKVKKEPFT